MSLAKKQSRGGLLSADEKAQVKRAHAERVALELEKVEQAPTAVFSGKGKSFDMKPGGQSGKGGMEDKSAAEGPHMTASSATSDIVQGRASGSPVRQARTENKEKGSGAKTRKQQREAGGGGELPQSSAEWEKKHNWKEDKSFQHGKKVLKSEQAEEEEEAPWLRELDPQQPPGPTAVYPLPPVPVRIKDEWVPTVEFGLRAGGEQAVYFAMHFDAPVNMTIEGKAYKSVSDYVNPSRRDVAAMEMATMAKFTQSKRCRTLLLDTRGANIVYRSQEDRFWGDGGMDGVGQNQLGKVLQDVRAALNEIESTRERNASRQAPRGVHNLL